MTEYRSIRELGCAIIEEYLAVAEVCVTSRKTDSGLFGYPATLILLAVVDAIGHGLKEGSGSTRLAVLMHDPFKERLKSLGCELNNQHIKNLIDWYRNLLAHSGLIAVGVALTPETAGAPFDFTTDQLTTIRVPVLFRLVRDSWGDIAPTFNPAFRPGQEEGWPKNPAVLAVMGVASGITEFNQVRAIKGEL